jgi:hypothetical protein
MNVRRKRRDDTGERFAQCVQHVVSSGIGVQQRICFASRLPDCTKLIELGIDLGLILALNR